MLVLTRKVGESVVISEDVYCTIVGFRNREVRLAFDAPKSIAIHRNEIQQRIYHEWQKDNWFDDTTITKENIVERLIHTFKSKEK